MKIPVVQLFPYRHVTAILFAGVSVFITDSSSSALLHHPLKVCRVPSEVMGKSRTMLSSSGGSTASNDALVSRRQKTDQHLPSMIVFDLDDCLWSPEMFTLSQKPSIPVKGDLGLPTQESGIVGMQVPHGPTVRLFEDARQTLRELATNPKYDDILLAVASSSEEPSYSFACFQNIEILPGLTMNQMFSQVQIGRTGQLSSRKTTHLSLIQKASSVPYEEMLFFDDCNWGDHVADIFNTFGVVGQRTPRGLTYSEFKEGLEKYKVMSEERAAQM